MTSMVRTNKCGFDPDAANNKWRNPSDWLQRFWEPCIDCCHQRRIGNKGEGGKWVCLDHAHALNNTAVISVGSGNDFSFEMEVQKLGISHIDTYDHTSNPPLTPIEGLAFHREIITSHSLTKAIRRIANTGKRLSVFKIDCEGCEYSVFTSEILSFFAYQKTQVLVELHFNNPIRTTKLWRHFTENGCYTFHKEANLIGVRAMEFAMQCDLA